jgi:uncharacterized repeat protein (TIGR03843 family)
VAVASAVLTLLERGRLDVKGRLPWSSNLTFLGEVSLDSAASPVVYKPLRGERPLWDFPRGLYKREVAAWALSEALAWDLVPPTVGRGGPLGRGSVQLFVDADFEQHYFTLRENPSHHPALARICLFDVLANNADRKSGHCLLGRDGRIYAIDNALTFHADWKLRTVIWDYAGERIPGPLLADVRRFRAAGLPASLADLLEPAERKALRDRADLVLSEGHFPVDPSGERYPWPLV